MHAMGMHESDYFSVSMHKVCITCIMTYIKNNLIHSHIIQDLIVYTSCNYIVFSTRHVHVIISASLLIDKPACHVHFQC